MRVATTAKVGVNLNGGAVDRGEMARVDVFRKAGKKGKFQYFLVPVYPHEIATMDAPPFRAVLAYASEANWPIIDSTYEFLWSINQKTWLRANKPTGEIVEGYFAGMDRSTGAIALSSQADSDAINRRIGVKTLFSLQKFYVDRLGRVSEVHGEPRSWHGKVCI